MTRNISLKTLAQCRSLGLYNSYKYNRQTNFEALQVILESSTHYSRNLQLFFLANLAQQLRFVGDDAADPNPIPNPKPETPRANFSSKAQPNLKRSLTQTLDWNAMRFIGSSCYSLGLSHFFICIFLLLLFSSFCFAISAGDEVYGL